MPSAGTSLSRLHSLSSIISVLFVYLMLNSSFSVAAQLQDRDAAMERPQITARPHPSMIDADPSNAIPTRRKRTEGDDSISRARVTSTTVPLSIASPSSGLPSILRPPSGAPTGTGTGIIMPTQTLPFSPLPSAFDTNIGNNSFSTDTCKQFFQDFLKNPTFKSCYPVSVLLSSSKSWFNAAKSFVSITRVLDASCSADATKCGELITRLGKEIGTKKACEQDLAAENQLVLDARNGFVSYKFVRDAACLKNPDTGSFCLADALSSETSVGNTFVYYIALGSPLPGSSRPECNKCLQGTMEVYSQGAGYKEQPLSQTYKSAAQQINIGCGPGFVAESIKSGATSSALPSPVLACISTLLLAYTLSLFDAFL